jgi:hypothetical protein
LVSLIRVTADGTLGMQGLVMIKMEEMRREIERERGGEREIRQVKDKMMAIQEDQDGDIWSTI